MGATPTLPGAIGIVGGGQLAWMLAEAAQRRGVALVVQTPNPHDPAVALASRVVQADVRDAAATRQLAEQCLAISFENEWLDLAALAPLEADGVRFLPSLEALRPLVCKRSQRELLQRLHLPCPRWFGLEQLAAGTAADAQLESGSPEQLPSPAADGAVDGPRQPALPEGFAYPLMAKLASGGYDGRGTAVLRCDADLQALLDQVDPAEWIAEEFVAFEQELALVAARDQAGDVVCFPLVQTHQHRQVCDWVLAPAEAGHALLQRARNIAASLLTALDYVGVLSIEFFYGPQGLLVNELAPRTHNSGHYSIEACSLSQYDQQLLTVGGAAAEAPQLRVPGALMVNLLGFEARDADHPEASYPQQRSALAALPGAHLHWYGKRGSSVGRKLGHVTVLLEQTDPQARRDEAMDRLEQIRRIWPLPPAPNGAAAQAAEAVHGA
ncbi:MAG: 5-(carboxyamino)imidazole ribonucleotide synthase [Vulcanococcus sp.]